MNTKLTLSLRKDIIERAKAYAKANNVSLSFLIENYLSKLVYEEENEVQESASIVDELSGILSLDNDFDHKAAFSKYLEEKHK